MNKGSTPKEWQKDERFKWEEEQILNILKKKNTPLPASSISHELAFILPTQLHRRTLARRIQNLRKKGLIDIIGEHTCDYEYYLIENQKQIFKTLETREQQLN